MAIVDGALGSAVVTSGNFSAAVINVIQWTGNLDNVFFDSRIFGDASDGVKEYRGPYQFTGTLTGYLDGTAVPTISHFNPGATASATITLTAFTSRTYVFVGHIHGWSPSVHRYEGLNAYTCGFRSHGSLTTIG